MEELRKIEILVIVVVAVLKCILLFVQHPVEIEFFATVASGFLFVIFLPALIIGSIFSQIRKSLSGNIDCGGLPNGGYLIGCTERALIYAAFMIGFYDALLSYTSILGFLSFIVAGKAIFRYSSKEANSRACADWYILGTFLSIGLGLAVSWTVFRFLL